MPLPPHAWCFARLCALWKNKAVTTGSGHSNQKFLSNNHSSAKSCIRRACGIAHFLSHGVVSFSARPDALAASTPKPCSLCQSRSASIPNSDYRHSETVQKSALKLAMLSPESALNKDRAGQLIPGDRVVVTGLDADAQLYNLCCGTVIHVHDDGNVALTLDEAPQGGSADLVLKGENLQWTPALTKTGSLWKRGRLNTAFQSRFFVLEGHRFSYFRDIWIDEDQKSERLGGIHCCGLTVQSPVDEQHNDGRRLFGFHLTDSSGRVLQCACDSASERKDWVVALRSAARAANILAYTGHGSQDQVGMGDIIPRGSSDGSSRAAENECAHKEEKQAPTEKVVFEGWVRKRGVLNTALKKRYFVLVGAVAVGSKSLDAHERRVLRYYKDWRSFHTRASPQVQVSLCCTLLSVCFRACHEHDQGQQGELACEGLEVDGDCGSSVNEGFRFLLTWSNGRQMPCACETFEQVPLRRCANFFHLPPVNHARATCSYFLIVETWQGHKQIRYM